MRALILGLGISGLSAARFLKGKGYEVRIFDDNKETLAKKSNDYAVFDPNIK